MSIRSRTWRAGGVEHSAWVVDYIDTKGKRRLRTFRTKRAAEDWAAETRVSVRRGTHIADTDSVTVEKAGRLWLQTGEETGLVRSSLGQCKQHLQLHIAPLIGVRSWHCLQPASLGNKLNARLTL